MVVPVVANKVGIVGIHHGSNQGGCQTIAIVVVTRRIEVACVVVVIVQQKLVGIHSKETTKAAVGIKLIQAIIRVDQIVGQLSVVVVIIIVGVIVVGVQIVGRLGIGLAEKLIGRHHGGVLKDQKVS